MGSMLISQFWILYSLAVIFLLNQFIDAFIIDNNQDSRSSYEYKHLTRSIRQTGTECVIPFEPPYTKYRIGGKNENWFHHYIEDYKVLEIICDNGYNIEPFAQNYSICRHTKFDPPLAKCLRTCPSLMSLISTNVHCNWNDPSGNSIHLHNCINPVEGTTVSLSCNTFYEEPSIKRNSIRVCIDGKWDPPIAVCYPICGMKSPKGQTNIVNGQNAEPGDYPWQIGVYNTQKGLICGGSILDYRVVLSAAHCFTDYNGNIKSRQSYFIAAGKYYREYNDDRDKRFAQYSKVLKIYVPPRYKGINNLQGFDIAIVILADPLEISIRVQPVCIDLFEESPDLQLSINKIGIVTGWGYTHNGRNLSEVLKEVEIPYVPYDQCYSEVSIHFRSYITHDKFCGGYLNNDTSVCGGDSGGGLIFKKLNSNQHYIKGIVSVSPKTAEGVCDSNQYSVYTSVDLYINFVRILLRYNAMRQNIECIQDDCLNNDPENISSEECSTGDIFTCRFIGRNCTLPNFPLDGKYILNQNDTYEPGSYVQQNSLLSVACNSKFGLSKSGANQSYCSHSGEWAPPLKNCQGTCPSLMSTETTTVKCTLNNKPLQNCINPVLGTKVILSCNPLYEEPNIQRIPIRVCRANQWHPSTSTCYPTCGKKNIEVIADQNVTIEDYPWQVGIYNSTTKKFICGGSIIEQNIILTAAHCVTDYRGIVQPTGEYTVAAGKYFSRYDEPRDLLVQHSNILKMHVPDRYTGRINAYALDIAVIILSDHFTLSEGVHPICIALNDDNLDSNLLFASDSGVVTGWGYSEGNGNVSDVLKAVIIPLIPYRKCFSEIPESFRSYFTADKICGGYINNRTSICTGDSGGAFVFKNSLNNRYFVRGIVSTSPESEPLSCDSNQYSLYTSVDKHIDFVRDLVALNQLFRKPIEYSGDDWQTEENQTEKKGTTSINCQIPNYGSHAKYTILGESENKIQVPGDDVHQYSALKITCDPGYKPNVFSDLPTICIAGKWNPSLTLSCLRICPSLNSTTSTSVTCKYHDMPFETCHNPIEGTTALLVCNPFYEEDSLPKNTIHTCTAGRWIPAISECRPMCGVKRPKGRPNIVNGQNATMGDYPWHVGIYTNINPQKLLICGGSIIAPHIILTAAHCLTEITGQIAPLENYYIATGKYHGKYDDDRDEFAQYSKILQVHVPETYRGSLGDLTADIAIVILTDPFTISEAVQPITGWGLTQAGGEFSEVLKELGVPIIPNNNCYEEVPEYFKAYFTSDKICAGYLNNGSSICHGDLGGALVLKNISSERYFVEGIASNFPVKDFFACITNQYSLYTSVKDHIDFIKNQLEQNQSPQSIEFISEDTTNEEADEK